LTAFATDFEALNPANASALSATGWKVFGNVFSNNFSSYLYGYGVFPAPNGTPGFSSVSTGQGGPSQGAQGLVVYSDYNNADHANGNQIEANVFQEQTIGAADVGTSWVFRFDGKAGDLQTPSRALAFIKTLDPNNGYATTNFLTLDTAALPAAWGSFSIPIAITPALNGQILQFGFSATATNYRPSGVYYDNVNFSVVPEATWPGLIAVSGLLLGLHRRSR
jgi:hypothetical protein